MIWLDSVQNNGFDFLYQCISQEFSMGWISFSYIVPGENTWVANFVDPYSQNVEIICIFLQLLFLENKSAFLKKEWLLSIHQEISQFYKFC